MMRKSAAGIVLGLVLVSGCTPDKLTQNQTLNQLVQKLLARLSDAQVIEWMDLANRYERILVTVAAVLAALLVVVWFARLIGRQKERERISRQKRAIEIIQKIEDQDLAQIPFQDRVLLAELLICRIGRIDPEANIVENRQKILKEAADNLILEPPEHHLAGVEKKARQAGISIHDGDLEAAEKFLEDADDLMDSLKATAQEFVKVESLRFSAVHLFVGQLDEARDELLSAVARVEDLIASVNQALDRIVAEQDHALVTRIFKGDHPDLASEGELPARETIDRLIEEIRSRLTSAKTAWGGPERETD